MWLSQLSNRAGPMTCSYEYAFRRSAVVLVEAESEVFLGVRYSNPGASPETMSFPAPLPFMRPPPSVCQGLPRPPSGAWLRTPPSYVSRRREIRGSVKDLSRRRAEMSPRMAQGAELYERGRNVQLPCHGRPSAGLTTKPKWVGCWQRDFQNPSKSGGGWQNRLVRRPG